VLGDPDGGWLSDGLLETVGWAGAPQATAAMAAATTSDASRGVRLRDRVM
jgi:hypothetical protein